MNRETWRTRGRRGRWRGQTYRGGRGQGRIFSTYNKGRGNDESDGGKIFNKSQV